MTRDELVDRLWADSLLFLTREEFAQTLDGWDLEPELDAAGVVVGVFLVKGPEFHFGKFSAQHQCTREILRRYPGSLIERYGYALTKTPKDDARQLRFNQRLGFYPVGEDDYDIHMRIDRLRTKEAPCP